MWKLPNKSLAGVKFGALWHKESWRMCFVFLLYLLPTGTQSTFALPKIAMYTIRGQATQNRVQIILMESQDWNFFFWFSKSKKNAQNKVQIIPMESQDWNFFFFVLKVKIFLHKIGSKLYSWRVKIGWNSVRTETIALDPTFGSFTLFRTSFTLLVFQLICVKSIKMVTPFYITLYGLQAQMFKFSLKLGIVAMQSHSLHSVLSYILAKGVKGLMMWVMGIQTQAPKRSPSKPQPPLPLHFHIFYFKSMSTNFYFYLFIPIFWYQKIGENFPKNRKFSQI